MSDFGRLVDQTNGSADEGGLGLKPTTWLAWREGGRRKDARKLLARGPSNTWAGAARLFAQAEARESGEDFEGVVVVEKDRQQRRFQVSAVRWVSYQASEVK
jgi:hypothetical protein